MDGATIPYDILVQLGLIAPAVSMTCKRLYIATVDARRSGMLTNASCNCVINAQHTVYVSENRPIGSQRNGVLIVTYQFDKPRDWVVYADDQRISGAFATPAESICVGIERFEWQRLCSAGLIKLRVRLDSPESSGIVYCHYRGRLQSRDFSIPSMECNPYRWVRDNLDTILLDTNLYRTAQKITDSGPLDCFERVSPWSLSAVELARRGVMIRANSMTSIGGT